MDYLNKLINFNDNSSTTSSNISTSSVQAYYNSKLMSSLNRKEILSNETEAKKVVYKRISPNFQLILEINGNSILQNLILTPKANYQNGDAIPIKCKWKRINNESSVQIKNISSLSYMPNSEDIGYVIQVEVCTLENSSDIAIAEYGPILIDNELANTIEQLIAYEKTSFNLVSCNKNNSDKNYVLNLDNEEVKLYNIDKNNNKKLVQTCRYSHLNPLIKLCNTNMTKFKNIFVEYFSEDDDSSEINNYKLNKDNQDYLKKHSSNSNSSCNSNNVSGILKNSILSYKGEEIEFKSKKEYEFLAMSKQCRELIYIITNYYILNSKIKDCKIFSPANYNTLSSEIKKGIYNLISDLKIHKEQNTIMLKNMKYLEYANQQLTNEFNSLEENFQITLAKINGKDLHHKNSNSRTGNLSTNSSNEQMSDNENEWKSKFCELQKTYNSLLAKEKALVEEKSGILTRNNNNLLLIENNNLEMEDISNENLLLEKELENNNKNINLLINDNEKTKKNCADLYKEILMIKKKNKVLANKNEADLDNSVVSLSSSVASLTNIENGNLNINELNKEREEINTIKKNNENLIYENKNLLMQINLLTRQKNDLSKEINKIIKDKNEIKIKISKLNMNSSKSKSDSEVDNLQKENLNLQSAYDILKKDFDALMLENKNLQENFAKIEEKNYTTRSNNTYLNMSNTSMSMNGYQLSPEEYEEYENLKKNKDENEVLIMQLRNNEESQEQEIKNLKEKIRKLKN